MNTCDWRYVNVKLVMCDFRPFFQCMSSSWFEVCDIRWEKVSTKCKRIDVELDIRRVRLKMHRNQVSRPNKKIVCEKKIKGGVETEKRWGIQFDLNQQTSGSSVQSTTSSFHGIVQQNRSIY